MIVDVAGIKNFLGRKTHEKCFLCLRIINESFILSARKILQSGCGYSKTSLWHVHGHGLNIKPVCISYVDPSTEEELRSQSVMIAYGLAEYTSV